MKNQSNIAAIALIMFAAMQASPAEAQEGERANATATDEDAGGEIVVVAQKRAENIQDIPISVTAIGARRWKRPASLRPMISAALHRTSRSSVRCRPPMFA